MPNTELAQYGPLGVAAELKPLAVTFSTAKKITGLGFTSLWKAAKEGRIEIVHVGRRSLISYRSLERLVLPPEPPPTVRRRGRPPKRPANEARA
jgi:hypothetical protein